MAVHVTANIDCHGKPRNMSWIRIDVYAKRRCIAPKSSGSYAKRIDFFQHFFLKDFANPDWECVLIGSC